MTEKRFLIIGDSNIEFLMQTQLLLPIYDNKERLNLKTCCDLLNELHDENEQLKQSQARMLRELLIYRRIANCSNCEYQNYDWFEDGDEFEICEKGNNNQQIEYHICKEWREF